MSGSLGTSGSGLKVAVVACLSLHFGIAVSSAPMSMQHHTGWLLSYSVKFQRFLLLSVKTPKKGFAWVFWTVATCAIERHTVWYFLTLSIFCFWWTELSVMLGWFASPGTCWCGRLMMCLNWGQEVSCLLCVLLVLSLPLCSVEQEGLLSHFSEE